MPNKLLESNIYNATIINNPTGDNNPVLKFKLSNGNYIEEEYNYGKLNWAKGQTFFVKYSNQKMKIIKKYPLEKLHLVPIIITPVLCILIISYLLISNKLTNLLENNISFMTILITMFLMLVFMILIPCLIYYTREHNFKKNCKEITKGKIISFVPIFKMHNTSSSINTYYEMEWRALLEFKTYNGITCRFIENDRVFGGDRDVLTYKFKVNEEVYIKYNDNNPSFAFIDDSEYNIQFEEYKGKGTTAKIIDIETIVFESIDKENKELEECFKQDYLICEYKINNEIYRERTLFPVNTNMFSIGQEISIRYNINNLKEFNVSYLLF